MSTPFAVFGPGILIATRTDISPGVAINVGFVQEFSMDATATIKELYGQKQFPLVQARGTIKATGKFKSAVVSGIAMNALMYGQSLAAGGISWNVDSTFTASTSSSAILVGSSLTFDADLGVKYAANGLPLQRVSTGSESTGKYSISATNTYNFGTTDSITGAAGGTALKITYSQTTTAGQSLVVTNSLIGTTPTFQLDYYTNLNQPTSKPFIVRIFECVSSKHAMQFKLEDYMIPEWDFGLYGNAADQVYGFYFPEVS